MLLKGEDHNLPQELQQRDWSSPLLSSSLQYVGLLTHLLQLVQQSLGVMATIEHPLLPLLIILLLLLCEQVPMPEVRALD
jgi:hypothetical protein